jgi:hypothetical protein
MGDGDWVRHVPPSSTAVCFGRNKEGGEHGEHGGKVGLG